MLRILGRGRSIEAPATATGVATPVMTPAMEIAHRHGDVYGAQAALVLIDAPLTIIDGGVHHGQSAEKYLEAFPASRIIGFEPEPTNYAAAVSRLAPFGERVAILPVGLSDVAGTAELKVNSHDGTHSLFEIGEVCHWDAPASTLARCQIETVTLDQICAERSVAHIDILKLDIQGAELQALRGARELLRRHAIGLIAAEVNFVPLYQNLPLFWDVAAYLLPLGYVFHGLFDLHHKLDGSRGLRWSDAIFLAPR